MSEESSPYWNWLKLKGFEEPDFALPFPKENENLQAVFDVLVSGGEAALSKREREAFQLVVREGRTVGEAAHIMSAMGLGKVSRSAVQIYVTRAGRKLRKLIKE